MLLPNVDPSLFVPLLDEDEPVAEAAAFVIEVLLLELEVVFNGGKIVAAAGVGEENKYEILRKL